MFTRSVSRMSSVFARRIPAVPSLNAVYSRSIVMTPVEPKPASSCCDDPNHVHTEAPKQVCDPYKQDGKPYDTATVELQMMGLDDGWSYDKDRKVLSKTFKFKRHFKPGDEPLSSAVIPGKPAGQVVGPGSCFTFAQHVQNLCTNGDHWIYNLTLTPRKAEAHVELKTIIRGGLTSSDFYMAMHLDALMHTTFPRKD